MSLKPSITSSSHTKATAATMRLWSLALVLLLAGLMAACGGTKSGEDKIPEVPTENTYSEAVRLKALNEAIAANPKDPENYFRRGALQLDMGALKEAYNDALRAAAIDSNQGKYYLLLAKIFVKLPNLTEANAAITKALQKGLDTPELHVTHGQILFIQQRYGLAIEALNKALKIAESYAPAYLYKGLVYAETGDTAKALSNLQTAIEQSPELVDAYSKLATLYSQKGDDKLARQYLESGMRFAPKDPFIHMAFGDYYERRGLDDSAREYFRKATFFNSDLYVPYLRLGALQARNKDWKPAITNLKMAVDRTKEDALPYLYLAKSHEANDEPKDAMNYYLQVVEMKALYVAEAEKGIQRLVPILKKRRLADSLAKAKEAQSIRPLQNK